jgi:hypothetical protein
LQIIILDFYCEESGRSYAIKQDVNQEIARSYATYKESFN